MPPVDHFCTYFDRNFLVQGFALAESLRCQASASVLWVLCLDEFTYEFIQELNDPRVRGVPLSTLEAADPELAAAKANRSKVEYFFTLSPCWPRYLLTEFPEITRLTYIDADMYWFGSPAVVLEALDEASVMVTEHRHPQYLAHHRRFGRFNVGILSFRNDTVGRECLDVWRQQCLAWCHDRVEEERYADQKYLDQWPRRFGSSLKVLAHVGVNLAPWNWAQYRYTTDGDDVLVNGEPLLLFHFARFRPMRGSWWFQSGQLEYGVMPWPIRQRIYGRYWRALAKARERIRRLRPGFDFPQSSSRGWHQFWRAVGPRVLFGSDWMRIGPYFVSGRLGLGRWSGEIMSWARTLRQRERKPATPAPKSETEIPALGAVTGTDRELVMQNSVGDVLTPPPYPAPSRRQL